MPEENFTVRSTDTTALFVRKWTPTNKPTGITCLIHGLGEHSGRYEHVADSFTRHDFTLYAFDLRGHGKSDGKRGDIPSYDQLLDDVESILDKVKSDNGSLPVFLYGHSMGGNIATNFLIKRTHSIRAALITSPWYSLSFDPPQWQISMGKMMHKLWPSLVQSNNLNADHLSRDREVGKAYTQDPLVHSKISIRLYFGIHEAGLGVIEKAKQLTTPILLVHGTNDPITSPKSTKLVAERSGNDLKLWDNLLHETHNELNKNEVIEYNIAWLKTHL